MSLMSEQLKAIIKKASSSFVIQIVGMMAGYLFGIIVSRHYGAESFGLLSLGVSLLNILTIVSVMGFDRASVKIIAQLKTKNDNLSILTYFKKVSSYVFCSSVILSVLFWFLSDLLLVHWYQKPQYLNLLKYFAPAIVGLSLMIVSSESLRGLKKIKSYTFFRLGALQLCSIIFLGGFVFKIVSQDSVNFRPEVFSYVASTLITGMLAISYAYYKIKSQTNKKPEYLSEESNSIPISNGLFKLALPLALASSMGVIMSQVSIQLLGRFVSEADIGIYAAAVKISMLSVIALKAVNSITTPQFAEAYIQGDNKKLKSIANIATTLSFIVSMPVVLFCLIFPEFILNFYGDEFKAGAQVLIILAMGRFIAAAAGPTVNILQMTGNEKIFQNILLLSLSSLISLSFWWIPIYGIIGAAWASLISIVLNNFICILVIKQKLGFWNFPIFLNPNKIIKLMRRKA
jgi:O-antigen/teichoic acid export membrane protein